SPASGAAEHHKLLALLPTPLRPRAPRWAQPVLLSSASTHSPKYASLPVIRRLHLSVPAFYLVQAVDVLVTHVHLQSFKHGFAWRFLASELLKLTKRLISQHAMPADCRVAIGSRVHGERSWPRVVDNVQDWSVRQRLFMTF